MDAMDTLVLARQTLLVRYRAQLRDQQAAIGDAYRLDADPQRLLQARAQLIDQVLGDLWREIEMPASLALVAVGGYGRQELYPASDVDVLLLLPDAPDDSLTAQLEEAVTLLYDLGLEIAPSVRTLAECVRGASADLTIQTALLEARLVTGNQELFQFFSDQLARVLDTHAFFEAKRKEQEERYLRYYGSPYSLEPNCKEAPGGLRDLQTVLWVARAAHYGDTWEDLAQQGFITREEKEQLARSVRFLQQLRVRLHLLVGRREDRLLFDYQAALAGQWGYQATANRRGSELFMQQYYRTAKEVTQINTILLQNIGAALSPLPEQPPQPINERFRNTHDLLDLIDEETFARDPRVMLEAFLLMQQHPELQGMSARTLRAL